MDSKQQPLIGATVYWKTGNEGTATDESGNFKISRSEKDRFLIASYVGFYSDTLKIEANKKGNAIFVLYENSTIEAVEIRHKLTSTYSSSLEPMKIDVMSEHELNKAACCNLSESFETNPSIDVSFTDAVTGTKQIQMLGLAGPYIQISRENMPDIRGLSAIYGLTFVPGPWVEAIHLNKGAGSVVNGFESITGQIDVQLRNPFTMDKLYVNAFANENGRYELNLTTKKQFKEHLATALLLHGKTSMMKVDENNDGFVDMPMGSQIIALNRWEIETKNKVHFQLGVKGTYFDNTAGQMDFEKSMKRDTLNPWGMNANIKRVDAWSKLGKVFENKPGYSLGFQTSGSHHEQNSFYGLHTYEGVQNSGYTNLIFQGIINNTNHIFKTGASYQYDSYSELFDSTQYNRIESIPGIFGEYAYSYLSKFNAVIGLRADYHNEFGAFVTPRVHFRYAPSPKWTLRASGGRGQRTANIFAENSNLLASSRQIQIQGNGAYAYGLSPEVAWNYGINATHTFKLWYRNGAISVDAYRTYFKNQIVVDFVQNPQKVIFYNLDGSSYSNSFQAQLDYELIKRLDIRIAYRWYDVQTTYNGILQKKPMISQNRAFVNLAYKTRNKFMFDYTVNWQGSKELPHLNSNPLEYRIPEKSPGFILMNAQISKSWNETFDVYIGAENLLNFTQKDPIIASAEPYSKYFDSSLIWGPINGREIYGGIRFRIK